MEQEAFGLLVQRRDETMMMLLLVLFWLLLLVLCVHTYIYIERERDIYAYTTYSNRSITTKHHPWTAAEDVADLIIINKFEPKGSSRKQLPILQML
jgi:cbb3-type cytochrome oxidase subunit 3